MSPAKRRGAGALGEGPRGLDETAGNAQRDLTVAVTGPTGTFGSGLIPLLQDDDRIGRIIGIALRGGVDRWLEGPEVAVLRMYVKILDDRRHGDCEVLHISPATVKRDWVAAKAWLYREMSGRAESAT